jgi:Kdo2-lipid IVA lauroyltransferase/acyltransferase
MARHNTPDLRDRLEAAGLRAVLAWLCVGGAGVGRRRGRALGAFAARWVSLRRRVALENLARAFPEKAPVELEAIRREMTENLGEVLAEFARFGRPTPDPPLARMRLVNMESIRDALGGGRGALLLTAHFGNWELLGAALAASGLPMTVLGARQRNPLVESLLDRYRKNMGQKTLTVGKSLRPLIDAFAAGTCVATLADQDGGPDGFFLDFLGRPASVQAGLFRIAVRREIPVVTGFAVREEGGWRGEVHPAEFPRAAATPEARETEARRLAALYTARVEAYVRAYPGQWFWVHRRWKTRPPAGRGLGDSTQGPSPPITPMT